MEPSTDPVDSPSSSSDAEHATPAEEPITELPITQSEESISNTPNPVNTENEDVIPDSSLVVEFRQFCEATITECLTRSLPSSNPIILESMCSLSELPQVHIDRVSSELDSAFNRYAYKVAKYVKNNRWWASFLQRDLEKFIERANRHYVRTIEERVGCSFSVRFGRVYAWAREKPSVDEDKVELTKHLQGKLRRHFSNLVWFSRTAKGLLRTHPMLNSLRHQLLRIRQSKTGRLVPPAKVDLTNRGNSVNLTRLANSIDDSVADLKHVIPSSLVPSFEKLVDKLTDLFLELPSDIPGVLTVGTFDSVQSKRNLYREVIVNTVISFYNHVDASTIALTSDEDLMSSAISNDSDLSSDGEHDAEDTRMAYCLNPAFVQAVLDRFDHINRPARKRPHPTINAFEEPVTEETHLPSVVPSHDDSHKMSIDSAEKEILEVLSRQPTVELQLSEPEPEPPVVIEEQKSDSECSGLPEGAIILEQLTEDLEEEPEEVVEQGPPPEKPVVEVETEKVPVDNYAPTRPPKRRAMRSLRTQRSGTPSENSFSEGEVRSDSEEERARITEELCKEREVPELVERLDVDIEEEEAEELIRMVNSQFQEEAATASDIDFTELEIMDEWIPTAASISVSVRSEIEEPPKDEILAEVEGLFRRSNKNSSIAAAPHAAPIKVNEKLNSLVVEALALCGEKMEQLVFGYDVPVSTMEDNLVKRPKLPDLPEDVRSSIERTSNAFKEHVTSILTNLLHAIPWMPDGEKNGSRRSGKAAPIITGKRGSRFIGMLKAYQQDVTRKLSVPVTS